MAFEFAVGAADGLLKVTVQVVGDEMSNHFGIGLGAEAGSICDQPIAQLHVVLDDAVDDDMNLIGGIKVRVRVLLVDAAMSCPARVADADRRRFDQRRRGATGSLARFDRGLELGQITDRANGLN